MHHRWPVPTSIPDSRPPFLVTFCDASLRSSPAPRLPLTCCTSLSVPWNPPSSRLGLSLQFPFLRGLSCLRPPRRALKPPSPNSGPPFCLDLTPPPPTVPGRTSTRFSFFATGANKQPDTTGPPPRDALLQPWDSLNIDIAVSTTACEPQSSDPCFAVAIGPSPGYLYLIAPTTLLVAP
ncbi:hypothetical protein VTN00DRAFT_4445 [Thermoascus crustaceus]|uniref:uncharacterized protein n=1 Tax=Thermoascus crustaceus TaxID=5088 RepID=UPI003742606D